MGSEPPARAGGGPQQTPSAPAAAAHPRKTPSAHVGGSLPTPDSRASSLPSALPYWSAAAPSLASSYSRGRGDRPGRRLLWAGGIVRLRKGALRNFASGRRTAAFPGPAQDGAGHRRRGTGIFVSDADQPFHGHSRRASSPVAQRT